MLTELVIRMSPGATVEELHAWLPRPTVLEVAGQIVQRNQKTVAIRVISESARPVNAFCRRLIEIGLAETVFVERLDV
jgi:hypothetical protein